MPTPIPNQLFLAQRAGRLADGRDVYGTVCPDLGVGSQHLGHFSGTVAGRDVYAIAEALCTIEPGDLVSAIFTGLLADGREVFVAYRCPCEEGSGSGSEGSGSEGSGSDGSGSQGSGSEGSGSEGSGSEGSGSEGSGSGSIGSGSGSQGSGSEGSGSGSGSGSGGGCCYPECEGFPSSVSIIFAGGGNPSCILLGEWELPGFCESTDIYGWGTEEIIGDCEVRMSLRCGVLQDGSPGHVLQVDLSSSGCTIASFSVYFDTLSCNPLHLISTGTDNTDTNDGCDPCECDMPNFPSSEVTE